MSTVIASIMLAAPQPGDYDPSTGKGPEWGKAAPIGLLVILLLGIAMFFLLRSFTRQLKKVPASFDPSQPPGTDGAEPAVSVSTDAARVPGPADDGPSGARRSAGPAEPPG